MTKDKKRTGKTVNRHSVSRSLFDRWRPNKPIGTVIWNDLRGISDGSVDGIVKYIPEEKVRLRSGFIGCKREKTVV